MREFFIRAFTFAIQRCFIINSVWMHNYSARHSCAIRVFIDGSTACERLRWRQEEEGGSISYTREIIGTMGLIASTGSRIIKLNFSRISLSGGRQDADVLPILAMSVQRTSRVHQVSHVSRHKIARAASLARLPPVSGREY